MGGVPQALFFGMWTNAFAQSTTYSVVSENYNSFSIPTNGYDDSMFITGSVTTSSPIPANQNDFDISGLITSFSFNDGQQSYDNTSHFILAPQAPPGTIPVDTDATGNIIGIYWVIYPPPQQTTAPISLTEGLRLRTGPGNGPLALLECPFAAGPNLCNSSISGRNYATASSNLMWSIETTPVPPPTAPANIPTLSEWGLILLASLLGLILYRRRIV